jgi:GNAT superfamily N-acetyltransferase
MLELPETISIYNVELASVDRAELIRLDREQAAKQIDGNRWRLDVSKTNRSAEGDHHWVWRKLIGENHSKLNWVALAVQAQSGAIEGVTTYRIAAFSKLSTGEGAVYIDRIAVAPRNRPWLVNPPKYKGIGRVLLLAAVRHSYSLGLKGRVWLTSLPSERTRAFYLKHGFQVIFQDDDGMIDFELPAIAAERWLRDEGFLL